MDYHSQLSAYAQAALNEDAQRGSPNIASQTRQLREGKFKGIFDRALNLVGEDQAAGSAVPRISVPTETSTAQAVQPPEDDGAGFRPYPSLAVRTAVAAGGPAQKGPPPAAVPAAAAAASKPGTAAASPANTTAASTRAASPATAGAPGDTSVAATAHAAMLRAQARALGIGQDPSDWEEPKIEMPAGAAGSAGASRAHSSATAVAAEPAFNDAASYMSDSRSPSVAQTPAPPSVVGGYSEPQHRGVNGDNGGYSGEDEGASVRNRGKAGRPKLRASAPMPDSSAAATPAPAAPPPAQPGDAGGDKPSWAGWGGLGKGGAAPGGGAPAGWRPIAELTAGANQLLDAALAKARAAAARPPGDPASPGADADGGPGNCGLPGLFQAQAQAKAMLDEARRMAEAGLMDVLARAHGSELHQQKQRLLELEAKLSEAEQKLSLMGSLAGTPVPGQSPTQAGEYGGGGGAGAEHRSPSVLSSYVHRDRDRARSVMSTSTVNHGAHGLPAADSPTAASTALTSPTTGASTPHHHGNPFHPPPQAMPAHGADADGSFTDLNAVAAQLHREKERQKHVRAQARRTAAQLETVTRALAEHDVQGERVNLEAIEADARTMLAAHSTALREERRRDRGDSAESSAPGTPTRGGGGGGGAGLPPLGVPTDTMTTPRDSITPEPGADSRPTTSQSIAARPGTRLKERFLQKAAEAAAALGDDDFAASLGYTDAASVEARLEDLRRRRAELLAESRAMGACTPEGPPEGGARSFGGLAGAAQDGGAAAGGGAAASSAAASAAAGVPPAHSSGGARDAPGRFFSHSGEVNPFPLAAAAASGSGVEHEYPISSEEARLIMDARAAKEAAVRRAIAAVRAAEEEEQRSLEADARRELAVAEAAAAATPMFAATREAAERALRAGQAAQDGARRYSVPITDASGVLIPRKKSPVPQGGKSSRSVIPNVTGELETSLLMGKPPAAVAALVPDRNSEERRAAGTQQGSSPASPLGDVEARARIAELLLSTPSSPQHREAVEQAQQQAQQQQQPQGSAQGSAPWRPPVQYESVGAALQRRVFSSGERPPALAGVTDEMLRQLAAHNPDGNMAVLDVSGCSGVSPNTVLEVARANDGLVSVFASGGKRWTVESVANLQHVCPQLQVFEVDVKASAVNNSLLELLQSPVVRVRRLEFGGTLRADAASILSAALKAAPHLGLVHFFSCNFHPHSLQAVLAGIVQSPNIKILELEGCGLTEDSAEYIAAAVASKDALLALSVRDNIMGDAGVKRIAEAATAHPRVQILDIGYNRVTARGAACLADMVCKASALRALFADGNRLGDDGLTILADSLRQTVRLEELVVGRNHVGTDDSRGHYQQGRGARALAGALRHTRSLRRLGLDGNTLGDAGARMLAVALRSNAALASLDVRSCGITGLGALELAEVLDREGCAIVELHLGGNKLDQETIRDIMTSVRRPLEITFDDGGN